MALIDSVAVWSYEVGARLSASVFCTIWKVDEGSFENYWMILTAKSCLIVVLMMIVPIMIPRNEEI